MSSIGDNDRFVGPGNGAGGSFDDDAGRSPGLYVHVPFCRSKCPYCDFYSVAHTPETAGRWLEAAGKEARLYAAGPDTGGFTGFDSLYLGGGTPSILDGPRLAALLERLRECFSFRSPCFPVAGERGNMRVREIAASGEPDGVSRVSGHAPAAPCTGTETTIEVNPDDVTPEKAAHFRGLGINRISVGVQSFDEDELRFLRRRHSARQTHTALERIRSAGFDNMGVDLIYGFQGQTRENWLRNLREALRFHPEHISCYQLTIEDGSLFGKLRDKGRIQPLGEEEARDFYLLTSRFLAERGYIHYEISNFARGEQYLSRHNQKYWSHAPYLGLGPAAHSFHGGTRWWNVRSVKDYCRALEEGRAPVQESENLSVEQLRLESLYLGFRTRTGVDMEIISSFSNWADVLDELQRSGLVSIHDDRVVPTAEGFVVADSLPLLFA